MSKEKIFAIVFLISAGVLLLAFGASPTAGIESRKINYVNQSGQLIRQLEFQAGREAFDFANVPPGGRSSIYLGRWSAYEVTVSGTLNDGSSFGPTQFLLPSTTISNNCTIRIRGNGNVSIQH